MDSQVYWERLVKRNGALLKSERIRLRTAELQRLITQAWRDGLAQGKQERSPKSLFEAVFGE